MQLAKQQGFSTSSRNLSCSRANNVHEKCPVTESQVEKIVQGLPRNKAPGMDKITSRVLKDLLPVSLPIITSLFNKSFATGSLVRSWKMTKVIPILRSGDFEDPVINRSISLLPMPSKVCKKTSLSSICSLFEQFRKDLEVSTQKSSSPLYRDSLASLFWGHFEEYGLEENLIDRVVRHVEGTWQHSGWALTNETPQHRCLHVWSDLVWKLFYPTQSIREDRGCHLRHTTC